MVTAHGGKSQTRGGTMAFTFPQHPGIERVTLSGLTTNKPKMMVQMVADPKPRVYTFPLKHSADAQDMEQSVREFVYADVVETLQNLDWTPPIERAMLEDLPRELRRLGLSNYDFVRPDFSGWISPKFFKPTNLRFLVRDDQFRMIWEAAHPDRRNIEKGYNLSYENGSAEDPKYWVIPAKSFVKDYEGAIQQIMKQVKKDLRSYEEALQRAQSRYDDMLSASRAQYERDYYRKDDDEEDLSDGISTKN